VACTFDFLLDAKGVGTAASKKVRIKEPGYIPCTMRGSVNNPVI